MRNPEDSNQLAILIVHLAEEPDRSLAMSCMRRLERDPGVLSVALHPLGRYDHLAGALARAGDLRVHALHLLWTAASNDAVWLQQGRAIETKETRPAVHVINHLTEVVTLPSSKSTPAGSIRFPRAGDRVGRSIRVEGALGTLPDGWFARLAVGIGKLFWPKEGASLLAASPFGAVIIEGGTCREFDIMLVAASTEVIDRYFDAWLAAGRQTGNYPGIELARFEKAGGRLVQSVPVVLEP